MIPPPPHNPNDDSQDEADSAGSLLLSSLLDLETAKKDPYSIWFGTVMLSHVLLDNPQCKEVILKKKLSQEDEEESVSLLHKCIFTVLSAHQQGADVRVILGILCFLATWMYQCPEAIKEFLGEGSNIQFVRLQSIFNCSFYIQLYDSVPRIG